MYVNRRNFRVVKEIGVEKHDGDVRLQTGSGNTARSRMRNASGIIIGCNFVYFLTFSPVTLMYYFQEISITIN